VDLGLLITVGRRSEIEMQPILPGLRRHRRAGEPEGVLRIEAERDESSGHAFSAPIC
jgi:hypothetical protein